MKAVVHDRYGPPDVLHIAEVERPVPADDELLVRVVATTVNRTDAGLRSAEIPISRLMTGLRTPKKPILGMEFSGVVEEVGQSVSEFRPGDEVLGGKGSGAHAEFVTIRESAPIAHKPAGMSFEEAAAVTDGPMLAFPCLRATSPTEGQHLLVYGASGSVGTAAVQIAKHHFGLRVTAVCSAKNLELVRSLGADTVIDRGREDFTKNGERYDAIFDAVGKHSFPRSRGSLKPGGVFVDTDLGFLAQNVVLGVVTKWAGSKRVKLGISRYSKEDLLLLRDLIEAGKYRVVIDRTFPFDDMIEATRYVESGHKTGNVVLTVGSSSQAA